MILIVSFTENAHVERVVEHLREPYVIVDQAWFPANLGLTVSADLGQFACKLRLPDGQTVDTQEVTAVWHRRIRPMTLDPALTDEVARLFAWSESNEGLLGALYSMDCYWMNHPVADEVAQRIPARRIGTEEDMAGVAIYLASRAGDYVVGNTIAVDGGVVYANAGLEIAG